MSLLVMPVPDARGATVSDEPPAVTEDQRALDQAEEAGTRVEVEGQRSEYATVYANPDGVSFTLEQSVTPVRVAKAAGGWQKPDATLERRSDGTIGPKAAAVSISLSGGGDGALAKIEKAGRSLELEWPQELPVPRIDGASAVYDDVLPDVDLKVTATVASFQQVLIVKTPEAAADPRLKKLTFGMETSGLDVRRGSAGNLAAVDGDGRTVFRAPPAQMWDSAGATAAPGSPASKGGAGTAASRRTGVTGGGAEPAASGSGLEPGQGDNVERIDVQVTKDSLTVVPDAAMLDGTSESAFPLFIDPPVTWGESERTLLRSDGYESYEWNNGDDGQGKGVGKCGTWQGYYCGPGYVQRLYFEFSPAELKGKNVLSASFRVTEPWAFQCDPRVVDLVRTTDISSSTTWTSRPTHLDLMVDRNVSAGRGSACDPDQPDAPIFFEDSPSESNENLTPTVKSFAAGKFARLTLMLKAHDETDTSAWKRFKNDAVLVVKYVGLPALPKSTGFPSGTGVVCSTDSGDPSTIGDPEPVVTGKPMAASGGTSQANLRIRWRTEKLSGATWSVAHTDVDGPTSGYVGSGAVQNRRLPKLTEGVLYRLKALTMSYDEAGANRLNTGYTTPCYFKVDRSRPLAPVVTPASGSPYTLCGTVCLPGGGPGTKGRFTFAPAAGDTNVAYQYRQSNSVPWSGEIKGSTVGVDIVPQESGTYQLQVRAKDTVTWGAVRIVSFLVKEGSGPVGRWRFDEKSGPAIDSSTTVAANQENATLATGAVRDGLGRRGELRHGPGGQPLATPVTDTGLRLNGTSGYAATSAPVLETRSAYTVSAWVRMENKATEGIVLSQDGAQFSPFLMWYENTYDSWCFGTKAQDAADGKAYYGVCGRRPAVVNAWTHLAGSYDPVTKTVALYVNGRQQGSVVSDGGWAASGGFQIGRYKWANKYLLNFNGSIDEVAAWQRVLSPAEVATEARSLSAGTGQADVELVAHWDPSGASGTTLADQGTGYGRSLATSGGAVLDGRSLVLDGKDDAAATSGPVVDDSGSFTVTAAVELDQQALLTKNIGYVGQVAGQRTATGSSWGLWFKLTGKEIRFDDDGNEYTAPVGLWHFGRVGANGAGDWVSSDEEAELGSPVRLTGVFDALDGTGGSVVRLHVGLKQNDMDKTYTSATGAGDFAVGKGYSTTAWGHHLPARVDDVRLWAGAMSDVDQIADVVGD
ncbi:LamG-like jellyroll fold domain-containing protein [Streptomyces cyaneofuscatus]|uniref:LamG-like jellyroll fold domain-containing protein n=1 Tax=Streptomyces cyaneofuscatus TaxID=66883 RepID=UPI0038063EE2